MILKEKIVTLSLNKVASRVRKSMKLIYLERIRGMDQVPLGLIEIVGKSDITFIPKVIEITEHSIMPPCELIARMMELPNDFPYDIAKCGLFIKLVSFKNVAKLKSFLAFSSSFSQ
jgi:hypothetical protein